MPGPWTVDWRPGTGLSQAVRQQGNSQRVVMRAVVSEDRVVVRVDEERALAHVDQTRAYRRARQRTAVREPHAQLLPFGQRTSLGHVADRVTTFSASGNCACDLL